MDWSDSPAQATFRQDVRTCIKQRLPSRHPTAAHGYSTHAPQPAGAWHAHRTSRPDGRSWGQPASLDGAHGRRIFQRTRTPWATQI